MFFSFIVAFLKREKGIGTSFAYKKRNCALSMFSFTPKQFFTPNQRVVGSGKLKKEKEK
jgi:hypothetical protein